MRSTVTEIAPDTYRISTFLPAYRMQLNQFLVVDELPFLMHAGFRKTFQTALEGVRAVIDPATLRWIGFSHFESDECGALNDWLGVAPSARAVCSTVGAMVSVEDFAVRAPRPLADGEIVDTGAHRLRFLSTPQLPHGWDAGLFFDETERTLFCSDLFFHAGDPEPVTETDIVGRAREAMRGNLAGPFAKDLPYTPYTRSTFQRLAELQPRTLASMHGSSFRGDGRRAILDFADVVDELLGPQDDRVVSARNPVA